MIYVDTSALVATFLLELRSDRVRLALGAAQDRLALSPWTLAEARSAFCLRARTGSISVQAAEDAIAQLASEAAENYVNVAVLAEDFTGAASMMTVGGPPLRAADALHLAIALRVGAQMATLDEKLAAAAVHHGASLYLL